MHEILPHYIKTILLQPNYIFANLFKDLKFDIGFKSGSGSTMSQLMIMIKGFWYQKPSIVYR